MNGRQPTFNILCRTLDEFDLGPAIDAKYEEGSETIVIWLDSSGFFVPPPPRSVRFSVAEVEQMQRDGTLRERLETEATILKLLG